MASNHNGLTERMLDFLRHRELATRRDLRDEFGVRLSRIDALLRRHIDAGIVLADHTRTEESRVAVICYRWNGAVAAGTRLQEHRGRSQPRKCLHCGADFLSAGPMNRLCNPCRTRTVSPYAP